MPWLGLGAFRSQESGDIKDIIKTALEAGYRSIDTASFYQNETGIGEGIKASPIPREDLFLTSKVWNDSQGYDQTIRSFHDSLNKLQTDYLDLYLIHWPVPGKFKETWRALEDLYDDGKVRAIGVSNFTIGNLKDLMADARITPAVNQVECHPWLQQKELHTYCLEHGIQLEAWSPLTQGKKLDDPVLLDIARKHDKSPAQILIRWDLEQGIVTIPKSADKARMIENANVFDFHLDPIDLGQLGELEEGLHFGPDPDVFMGKLA